MTIGNEKHRGTTMALTKDFRETIRERAQREPRFRQALLREAIELMLSGDEKTGRAILRNYINATVGFRQLEQATRIPANSLMRMFGPGGNPSAKNLFGVLAHLQAQEGVNFAVRPRRALRRGWRRFSSAGNGWRERAILGRRARRQGIRLSLKEWWL